MVNDERSQQVWSGDDAISTLPLELLLQITKDLYPADIIRIQRVSKRWREIFSNYAIITSALHQTLEFLGLKNANAAVSDAITYFRWEHGLRSARPVKKIFLPWSTPRRPQEVFYHSRRLCYRVSDRSNEVHMLDLETGERSTWSDEARDVSGSIGLSDRFLAMITTVGMFSTVSLVTVWDVRTSQRWVKQLPCPIDRITIEGDKVVIPCGGNKWKPRPILVWDLNLDGVQEVGNFRDLCMWHVDANDSTLIAIEINWDINPPEVQQTKWRLTGEQIDRNQFDLSLRGRRVDKKRLMRPRRGCCRTCCHKTVTQLISATDDNATIHLTHDYAINQLSVQWIEHAEPISRRDSMEFCVFLTSDIAYSWGKYPRQLVVYNAAEGTAILRPYQFDSRQIIAQKLKGHPPSWRKRLRILSPEEGPIRVFGDHEVFGLASDDGAQLWFFNPNFVPDVPNAHPFLAMEESG